MAGSDDLRFHMMGLGGPMAPAAPAAPAQAAPAAEKKDAGYPTFEATITEKARYEAAVASAKAKMARLEEIAKTGSAGEKADARKALRAYDHTLELLKKAYELAQQIIQEKTAAAKAAKPGKK